MTTGSSYIFDTFVRISRTIGGLRIQFSTYPGYCWWFEYSRLLRGSVSGTVKIYDMGARVEAGHLLYTVYETLMAGLTGRG